MYDNLKSPGRNDECWCGSGRKYKKCHLDFDERLQSLYEQGFEVPQRSLLKTPEEIEGIKRSAAINIGVLDLVAERIGAGVSTEEIDKWIYDYTVEHGGIPADLDYEGYPKSVCTSINEVVCHGIPSPDDVLKDGDIVNVDCSTILDGYYSDSSRMFCIGEVSDEKRRLVEETEEGAGSRSCRGEAVGIAGRCGRRGARIRARAGLLGGPRVRRPWHRLGVP